MFKGRSKLFGFIVAVQSIFAVLFLLYSSISGVVEADFLELLTAGTLFSFTGVQTTGILMVVSAVLNVIGYVYKNKEIMSIGVILAIVTLVTDFLGTTLMINFIAACDEVLLCGCVLYLLILLITIVILMIGFDDQLKTFGKSKSTKKS